MKIKTLTLSNFKGCGEFSPDFKGKSAVISGPNFSGKTTCFDGYSWLLLDKDSEGSAQFGIKPAGGLKKGAACIIEGAFVGGDGKTVTLKKEYVEKWVKPRGQRQKEFQGHETNYYVDGVPVLKKAYLEIIGRIAPGDLFSILSNPKAFNSLPWKDRRSKLFTMAGDIPEPSGPKFAQICDDIANCPDVTGSDKETTYKAVLMKQRKKLNDELERVPIRIDELQRQLASADKIDTVTIAGLLGSLKAEIENLEKQTAKEKQSTEIQEKRKRLFAINEKIDQVNEKLRKNLKAIQADQDRAVTAAEDTVRDKGREISTARNEIRALESEMQRCLDRMENLRGAFNGILAEKTPEIVVDKVCPTCGQDIPESLALDKKAMHEAAFNKERAERLDAIDKEGQEFKEKHEKAKVALKVQEAALKSAEKEIKKAEAEIESHNAVFGKIREDAEKAAEHELENLEKQAAEVETEIEALEDDIETVNSDKEAEIDAKRQKYDEMSEKLAEAKAAASVRDRIAELLADEKRLAGEVDGLEEKLDTLEAYIRAKCDLITDKVDKLFKRTKWKLFEPQINGGIAEVCEAVWESGAVWQDMSHSEKIYCGIDCINALSKHYGLSMPIFIDDAEGVLEPIETDAQVIRLHAVETESGKLEVEV